MAHERNFQVPHSRQGYCSASLRPRLRALRRFYAEMQLLPDQRAGVLPQLPMVATVLGRRVETPEEA
jgi:hypothetical protein